MKKAKNVFAIIAIVLGVVAAILAIGLPFIDGIAAKVEYAEAFKTIGNQATAMKDNLLAFFKFDWFGDLGNHVAELVTLIVGGLGLISFIVLLVLMCCKKHVKGLGWWFPMLIVFALSLAVIGGNRFNNAGYVVISFVEIGYIGNAATYVAIGACALFIVSTIFYMCYVCKARKTAMKIDSARQAALAKIESLLGGNK